MFLISEPSRRHLTVTCEKGETLVKWSVDIPYQTSEEHITHIKDVFAQSTALYEPDDFNIPGGFLKAVIEDELSENIPDIRPVKFCATNAAGDHHGPFEYYGANGNLSQRLVLENNQPVSALYHP